MKRLLFLLLFTTIVFAQQWEDGTFWVSTRYSDQLALSYVEGDLIHSYVWDSFCRHEPVHVTYKYADFTVSHISFPDTGQKVATTLPLLQLPLTENKTWGTTWSIQKTPGGTIYTYPVSVQVIGKEFFPAYNTEAYLLNITLNNTVDLLFHYVPANSTFPGQPPLEVYEEIESGQPFRLIDYGISSHACRQTADDYYGQICPKAPLFTRIINFFRRLFY